jgi:hypothetical protein
VKWHKRLYRIIKERQPFPAASLIFFEALEISNSKELQNYKYDDDNDQNVNPITGARDPGTDIPAEKAKQPQDKQNYDDGPQHVIPPFE